MKELHLLRPGEGEDSYLPRVGNPEGKGKGVQPLPSLSPTVLNASGGGGGGRRRHCFPRNNPDPRLPGDTHIRPRGVDPQHHFFFFNSSKIWPIMSWTPARLQPRGPSCPLQPSRCLPVMGMVNMHFFFLLFLLLIHTAELGAKVQQIHHHRFKGGAWLFCSCEEARKLLPNLVATHLAAARLCMVCCVALCCPRRVVRVPPGRARVCAV